MSQEFPLRQSSVATYLECPRKARLEYLEGQRGPTYPRMATGTAAHAGADFYNVARIAGRPSPTVAEVVAVVRDAAERLTYETDFTQEDDAAESRTSLVERAVSFATAYVEQVAPAMGAVTASERPFSVAIEVVKPNAPNAAYELTGTIDCETTSSVRDLKTTTRVGIQPKHIVQLATYALASTHVDDYYAPPDGVIDTLVMSETKARGRTVRYLPTFIPAEALAEESIVARETIVRVAEAAERGDYPRNPTMCEQYNRPCSHLAHCMPWRASIAEAREAVVVTAPKAEPVKRTRSPKVVEVVAPPPFVVRAAEYVNPEMDGR